MSDSETPATAGRPGISLEQARTAADTWFARTGRLPSTRELRTALGDKGSLSTLGRHLQVIRAERLMEGERAEQGSVEDIALNAMNAALKLLSADVADAAEQMVIAAERTANERVATAASLQAKAEAQAADVALERERALGQLEALHERVQALQEEMNLARTELSATQERERQQSDVIQELKQTLSQVRTERDMMREQHQTLEQEREQWRSEVSALHQQHTDAQALLTKRTAALSEEQRNNKRLEKELTHRDNALKKAETARQALLATQEAERQTLSALREKLAQLTADQTALQRQLSTAEATYQQAATEQALQWRELVELLANTPSKPDSV